MTVNFKHTLMRLKKRLRSTLWLIPVLMLLLGIVTLSSDGSHSGRLEDKAESSKLPPQVNGRAIIGIITNDRQLANIGKAALDTWISASPWKVVLFTDLETRADEFDLITLPVSRFDSPVKKTFAMWQYFYQRRREYEWFVQTDLDTYLNIEKLRELLFETLDADDETLHYIGQREMGTDFDSRFLGSNGWSYCAGVRYILNKKALAAFGDKLSECQFTAKTNYTDVELARCIHTHVANIDCRNSPLPFKEIKYTNVDGVIYGRKYSPIDIPDSPPSSYFNSPLVYPLKRPESFYQIHHQTTKGLRPVIDSVIKPDIIATEAEFKTAKLDFEEACVNNPVMQLLKNNAYIKECPSPSPEMPLDTKSVPMFVLNLPDKRQNFEDISNTFARMGYRPERFLAVRGADLNLKIGRLKDGEIGYRETMKLLINQAIHRKLERIIVFDDDAVPHKNFDEKFQQLLEDDRCGGYMFTKDKGGVLLLGASIWINGTWPRPSRNMGGWNIVTEDMKNATYDTQCFNACNKTFGSFAVMMHKSVYKPILDWLETSQDPYDWVFSHLSNIGHIVRAAYPNLVIQDVAHESQVDTSRKYQEDAHRRAQIHRWKLDDYQFE